MIQRSGNGEIQRCRTVDDCTFGQRWLGSFGGTRKPDPFGLVHAQFARLASTGENDCAAQIDGILRNMPAAVNIRQRVICVRIGQHFLRRPKAGKLGMITGFRLGRKGRPQCRHVLRISIMIQPQTHPPRIFDQAIGQRHRNNAVANFGSAQDRKAGEPVVEWRLGRKAPIQCYARLPGALGGPCCLCRNKHCQRASAAPDVAGQFVQHRLRALATYIGIDQPRGFNPACRAKGLGRIVGGSGAEADAAIFKRADGCDDVNRGGNGGLLASIGKSNLDGRACQFAR